MAVYVYSTGSIPASIAIGNSIQVNINNRTTSIEEYRALIWNTSNGLSPKELIAEIIDTMEPNGAVSIPLTALNTADASEIEVRLTNPHMNVTISGATGGFVSIVPTLWTPGYFFTDSSQTQGLGGPQPIPVPPCGDPACTWIEYADNPVYDPPATTAYYQTVRYSSTGFDSFGTFAYYKMWYDYNSNGGIASATSPDGINWTFQSVNTGLVATARHSRVLYDVNGFGIDAPYRIWYWDSAYIYIDQPPETTILRMLRTATSLDGILWTNDTTTFQNPSAPLFLPGAQNLNRGSYGPVDILYYADNPTTVDLAAPFNNRYVMYNSITAGNIEEIALAVSGDGLTWSKVGPVSVLGIGPSGSWDDGFASDHGVVLQLASNNFKMWYSGGRINTGTYQGIGCASSTDGVNWTKSPANPVFHITDGVAWRAGRTYNPWVLFDSSQFSGHGDTVCYKFWMTGAPTNSSSNTAIGYATNTNEGV